MLRSYMNNSDEIKLILYLYLFGLKAYKNTLEGKAHSKKAKNFDIKTSSFGWKRKTQELRQSSGIFERFWVT